MDADSQIKVSMNLQSVKVLECIDNTKDFSQTTKNDIHIAFEGQTIPVVEDDHIVEELKVKYLDKKENRLIFSCKIQLIFIVRDLSTLITVEKNGKLSFKIDIIPDLVSITVGALRGIVAVKTDQTPLESIPIPLINPIQLLGGGNDNL